MTAHTRTQKPHSHQTPQRTHNLHLQRVGEIGETEEEKRSGIERVVVFTFRGLSRLFAALSLCRLQERIEVNP